MRADVGTAAASSNVRPAGLSASPSSGAATYSANAPPLRHCMPLTVSPKTSSPTRNRETRTPTASTTPAMSIPGTGCLGRRRPPPMIRSTYGTPSTVCQTSAWTDAARTRTSTSSSRTTGRGTSRTTSASGDPYRSWTTALMRRAVAHCSTKYAPLVCPEEKNRDVTVFLRV